MNNIVIKDIIINRDNICTIEKEIDGLNNSFTVFITFVSSIYLELKADSKAQLIEWFNLLACNK